MDGADDLVVKLSSPNPFRRPAGMSIAAFADFLVDEFKATVAQLGADRIGAFVGEPVQASGGVIVPPDGYLKRIREICRDNDILYISDEVVTAFGRLGACLRVRRSVRARPRHDHLRQGRHVRLFPARRRRHLGAHPGTASPLQPCQRDVRPRLYLHQPSGRLRGRAEEPRPAGRRHPRSRPQGRALFPGAAEDAGGTAAGRRGARRRA